MRNRSISLALAGALIFGLISGAPASQGSGCMPTTGTVSGLSFAQLINQAIAAIISGNSGASAPATDCSGSPQKGQIWLDTSVTPNVEKRYDGNSWVVVGAIDSTNHLWSPPVGGGTASITAASTTDICAAPSALQTISGSTTITSFGSACTVGVTKKLRFSGSLTVTYNSTSMVLPGQRDFAAAPGDMADATYLGAGNWQVSSITKIDGSSVTNPAVPLGTIMYGQYGTLPPKTLYGAAQAISRASYPDYFAAVTRLQSATLTAGNNTLTSVGNTDGLGAGMPLEGTGIQAGTTISSVTSSTIVMSNTATANGAQSVRAFITGYGFGGDSTTVGLTDCRSRAVAGRDNVVYPGGSGRMSVAMLGANPNAMNAGGGVSGDTLPLSALPNYAPGFTGILDGITVISTVNLPQNPYLVNPDGHNFGAMMSNSIGPVQSNGSFTPRGTVGSINGGQAQTALSKMQPTLIAECVVVVLP